MINADLITIKKKNLKPCSTFTEEKLNFPSIYNYMIFQGNHGENIGHALSNKGNFLEVILRRFSRVKKKILILQILFGSPQLFRIK